MDAKDESSSYVTYGMLHKNHEFVDWVRVDLEEDDMVRVQNANANILDDNSLKDMDERAFEKLKAQWQEISVSEATSKTRGSGEKTNSLPNTKVRDGILLGKKLLASASAKTLTPDSISYGVFDADWNPVKLSPRHSNVDVAILLHAASKEGKNNTTATTISETTNTTNNGMRTYLTGKLETDPNTTHSDVTVTKSMVIDGKLPIVPVRRSIQQQFLIKQSVQLFFRKDSIQFFACFPLRYSPRTIYRFDMVNGGIDHTFWQKMKINNSNQTQPTIENNKPSMKMNEKLIEMRSKMASNTAEIQKTLRTGTDEFRTNFNTKVSTTKESILNLTSKKGLLSNNNNDDVAAADVAAAAAGEKAAEKPKVPAKQRLSLMRMKTKMANNRFSMKNSFASKASTTTEDSHSLLETNQNKTSQEGESKVVEKAQSTTNKLAQMKLRMSENTSKMRFSFMNKKNVARTTEGETSKEAVNEKANMTDKLSQMKLKMSDNTNQMKERMSQNTLSMKTSFASKMATTKTSFWNVGKKNGGESKAGETANTDSDVNSSFLSEEEFTFTIDGEDDDDNESGLMTALTVPSTTRRASSPAGYVALSFDDAPCRFEDRSHSQLETVLDLLKKYDAKATFMVISSFLADCHEPDMIRLLQEGHELANHGTRDKAMDKMATSVEVFVEALEECNSKIEELQKKADTEIGVKWFRAPQSRYTKIMEEGLVQKGMHNVMCDAYAACPIVEDGPWIADMLNKQIRNGSVALLHMPEKCGFREHTLEALEQLLEHLQKRNFKVVSIGELHKLAEEVANSKSKQEESKKAVPEEKAVVPV